ncbi:tRNA (adenosine(37)-N6)-threonylcarbamoyltransferase complex dimerization subunit type 1 TsaB [Sphingomonas aracearum]|uniref:tRNA (Adenosine(37)-N6)-threonylcarbamoyltransferase complex dimerization subunit type 1 TsaB n=1 Tax=Sphingomonas aracearum TaxID=2283317 RepID=A0A369VVY3_9SPHN|nr:tRNA (adenosine(37)-N6)-threonylcarbamoyltransferase complex dimerization subunit type 1 TsaB [Sphingomonas aracearum]RDE05737.1 tRNA (adenosine(37)-N6)-threonylcarbamoyltransferase complex dimerization subunit type 1 TsaB [Sphingomonas aracearum]
MPRTLVIETATAACSVALLEDGAVVAARHEIVGRGHAERLVPMIAELPDGGHAPSILVDVGPGSFTGIRVGLAAARGLALGWGAAVHGFSSLALVAARGLADHPHWPELAAVLEGGHGELFVQNFAQPLVPGAAPVSLRPDAALASIGARPVVGSGLARLQALCPDLPATEALPAAADVILLPPSLATLPPRPFYGRAPDAVPAAERRAR